MTSSACLLDLGDDALGRIFDALPDERDCYSRFEDFITYGPLSREWSSSCVPLSLTCRRLDQLYRRTYVQAVSGFKMLKLGNFEPKAVGFIERVLHRYTRVSKLAVSGDVWCSLVSTGTPVLAFAEGRIAELKIYGITSVTELAALPGALPALSSLYVEFKLGDELQPAQSESIWSTIKSLRLLRTLDMRQDYVERTAQVSVFHKLHAFPPLLRSFKVDGLILEKDSVLDQSLPGNLDDLNLSSNLSRWDAHHSTIPLDEVFSAISCTSPFIKHLVLMDFWDCRVDWSKLLPVASSLLSLTVCSESVGADYLNDRHLYQTISSMTSLQQISMERGDFNFDETLRALATLPTVATIHLASRLSEIVEDPDSVSAHLISLESLANLSCGPCRSSLTKLTLEIEFAAQQCVPDRYADYSFASQETLYILCSDLFAQKPGLPKVQILIHLFVRGPHG